MSSSDGEVDESSDSDYVAPFQTTFFISLLLAATVGNGVFFFLFIRYKTLRTVHHALFADLSTIDLLNSLVNIPLSICYVAYDIPISRGKTFAWIVSFLHSFFGLLSLSSMALQMIDRSLAVCWPIFYKANKSMAKIIAIILTKWLLILTIVLLIYVPLYDIDIGKSPVLDYRELYAKKSGQTVSKFVVPVFVFMILLFGGLSLWNLKRRPRQVGGAPQNARNSPNWKARKKAVYTILILLIIALVSYLPAVIQSSARLGLQNQPKIWPAYAVIFMPYVPSAVNPFIVSIRVKRFSDELKSLRRNVKPICLKHQADVEGSCWLKAFDVTCTTRCDDISVISRATSCTNIAQTQKTKEERSKSF